VELTIDDVNDEAPVFTQSSYEFSLDEHLPVGVVLGHVTAVDRDAPPFNHHLYKIVDAYNTGADEMFSIDPRSGRIISTVTFDREVTDELVLCIHYKLELGRLSILADISEPKISAISIAIFVTAALFDLYTQA